MVLLLFTNKPPEGFRKRVKMMLLRFAVRARNAGRGFARLRFRLRLRKA